MAREERSPNPERNQDMSETDAQQEQNKLDRPGVFAALKRLGADRAVVQFSGGNDEGGPDSITLLTGENVLRTLPTWWQGGEEDAQLIALSDALSAPVFEAYGTFAGDFEVSGEVIWDVAGRTVQMIRDERSEFEHFEELL
jgi:hypothetical protein